MIKAPPAVVLDLYPPLVIVAVVDRQGKLGEPPEDPHAAVLGEDV